jgi:hypothetical protein
MSRPPRLRGDDGGAMVEFALVLPVLVVLVLGIMDYGFALRESNRLERAVSSAARTGASLANYKYTDFEILKSVDSATAGIDGLDVQKVVVYKTTVAGGPPPANCLTGGAETAGGVTNSCNVYTPNKIEQDNANVGFPGRAFGMPTSCGSGWDSRWCPMSPPPPAAQSRERRRNELSPPDYIGVYIEADYQGITDLLPTGITMEKHAVFAIEPCFKGDPNCEGF